MKMTEKAEKREGTVEEEGRERSLPPTDGERSENESRGRKVKWSGRRLKGEGKRTGWDSEGKDSESRAGRDDRQGGEGTCAGRRKGKIVRFKRKENECKESVKNVFVLSVQMCDRRDSTTCSSVRAWVIIYFLPLTFTGYFLTHISGLSAPHIFKKSLITLA